MKTSEHSYWCEPDAALCSSLEIQQEIDIAQHTYRI